MSTLTLTAPAKLNLSLRVLSKRDDGFHDIDSVMVKVPGLSDRIDFDTADAFAFTCSDPSLACDESNLIVKAVRAYEHASTQSCKFRIHLEKNIPHGAGLGGGSSDAASTLLGLNQLHDYKLCDTNLHAIAASLGSDIPFFLSPSAARASGRGEIITPIPSPPALRVLLLKPQFSVATPDAYRRWQHSQTLPGLGDQIQDIDGLGLINDLERPVFGKFRFLAELKQWLITRRECRAALLCGSGSTVFAVLHDGADAGAVAKAARLELDPQLWHWSGTTAD